ncbi:MAG: hypothetical protein R3B69_04200 [Candidatus Paceibacterota bacterium]
MGSARDTLATFTLGTLPNLDVVVLGALELFAATELPPLPHLSRPLVLGSAGALAAARAVFADKAAVFADESSYQKWLTHTDMFDGVVILSASGGKHAIEMAQAVAEAGMTSYLLTNNPTAAAAKFVSPEHIVVFPKNREPYTNNTSTYLGMILAASGESATEIYEHITTKVDQALLRDFSCYSTYTFVVPKAFGPVAQLIRIKFEEMFEPMVHGRAYTEEEIKHAKTVIESGDEIFISLDCDNVCHGCSKNRLCVPMPAHAGPAAAMAMGYYIVGKVQAAHPPYFKNNIERYAKQASDMFGQDINPIVE